MTLAHLTGCASRHFWAQSPRTHVNIIPTLDDVTGVTSPIPNAHYHISNALTLAQRSCCASRRRMAQSHAICSSTPVEHCKSASANHCISSSVQGRHIPHFVHSNDNILATLAHNDEALLGSKFCHCIYNACASTQFPHLLLCTNAHTANSQVHWSIPHSTKHQNFSAHLPLATVTV